MRKTIISFLLGIALGIGFFAGIYYFSEQDAEDRQARDVLDYAIDEWTIDRTRAEELLYAQIRYQPEFSFFRKGFIPDTVKALATRVESIYKIPQGVTVAQWCLESRFGLSDLRAKNYFGHTLAAVKQYMDQPMSVWRREKTVIDDSIVTGKPVAFAKYGSMAECFDVHGKYLSRSKLYANAFTKTSSEEFARALSEHYATDPEYALKLIVIMRRYNLN
jgi:hypothetical protein